MMRDGLLNSSAVSETRRSIGQASDIGVLTYVTIMYLPFSLASSIFGISTTFAQSYIWLYWMAVSVGLCVFTFYFAFGRRLRDELTRRRGTKCVKPR